MKPILFAVFIFSLVSCVSQKKYKILSSTSESQSIQINNLTNKLSEEAIANKLLLSQIELLKNDISHKEDKIKLLTENEAFFKKTNHNLTEKLNSFAETSLVNADVMKKTLLELDKQNLKVAELSQNLQHKDSLNILLVKKVKKESTNKKLINSIEKLGFIF
jgi:hypothetical protein